MLVAVIGCLLLGAFQLLSRTLPYPWHASCKIEWHISQSCGSVRSRLVDQIDAWSHNNCPNVSESCPSMPCGQKCKYELVSLTEEEIKALHTTPKHSYVDSLTFTFLKGETEETSHCHFKGFSSSRTWYAILDFGTNYCNLRNLIDGAGLSSALGFTENTTTEVCTQYDKTDCERF